LEDGVSTQDFVVSKDAPTYKNFSLYNVIQKAVVEKNGLLLVDGQTFSATLSPVMVFTRGFTVAFWWNSPSSVGYTRHAVTKALQTKIVPIVAKATSTTSGGEETVGDRTFVITEQAYSATQNKIVAHIWPTSGDQHVVESEPYVPGLVHILLSFDHNGGSAANTARIDINGKLGSEKNIFTGNLLSSTAPLRLNNIGITNSNSLNTYVSHKTTQVGSFIADLVMLTAESIDESNAIRMIRYGLEYITDTSLIAKNFIDFGVSYDQPSTISTNQIFSDGSSIYVARSNGELIKGERPIWDKPETFDTPKSIGRLNIVIDDSTTTVQWTEEGILIKGTSIRA